MIPDAPQAITDHQGRSAMSDGKKIKDKDGVQSSESGGTPPPPSPPPPPPPPQNPGPL